MNLKNIENKSELISKIDDLTNDISEYLKSLAKDDMNQKRAALIYYWLRDYKNYLKNESKFNSKCLIPYKRGNVININLGFNLGSELGGLHYGIVLADSAAKNPNVIIVPMTSVKKGALDNLRPSQIYIGKELYTQLQTKFFTINNTIEEHINYVGDLLKVETNKEVVELLKKQMSLLKEKVDITDKVFNKIKKLKDGSIILCDQVKTISKMRIVDPQKTQDSLYGIKVSNSILDKIDETIIMLYTKKH